ncbi:RNase H domain-containing protein [Trichonephila clavipes]|nr:RNase H domain-containing protein [Trichonephila clavipes]
MQGESENYNSNTRFKRSSPMQFDSEIGLEHNKFSVYQELLLCWASQEHHNCNKSVYKSNVLRVIIEALNLYETLPILEQAKGLIIFCDSKAALHAVLNGGSWIIEEICSRLLRLQELDKACFLQWLPAHVDIVENADKQAKEAGNLKNDNFVNVTLLDGNAVTNFKLREESIPVKHQLCNRNGDYLITNTRIRTGHYDGMKIDWEGKRTYRNCDNCLDTELKPAHIFDSPAILAALKGIGVLFSSINLYVDNIEQIARTVIWAHGTV